MSDDSQNAGEEVVKNHRPIHRVIRWVGAALLIIIIGALLIWSTLAIYFADTHGGPRTLRAVIFAAGCVTLLLVLRKRYRLISVAVLLLGVLAWYLQLRPSNDRDWSPDVAKLTWAEIDGDKLLLHNVRNFDYRSETDFDAKWEDRHYDLSKIRGVDFMLVYWGSPNIAHVMVSFGFEGDDYLCVSIETRKERGESYSAIEGFFRQYELVYVIADERDVVRLRTNYRNAEDVYLYHTKLSPAQARQALLSNLEAAGALRDRPEFYNALTSNCASNVLAHARRGGARGEWSMDVILSGHAARQAYRNGQVDTRLPFEELQARSKINDAAHLADQDPQFSKAIRASLP